MAAANTAVSYLKAKDKKKVVDGLTTFLSDSFVLYMKTHVFHWNVEGPNFHPYHELFGAQYTEIWEAMDDIAERIRALDAYAPTTAAELLKTASLKESKQNRDAKQMLKELAEGNDAVATLARNLVDVFQSAGDEVSADLMIGRANVHEKNAWMLRSSAK